MLKKAIADRIAALEAWLRPARGGQRVFVDSIEAPGQYRENFTGPVFTAEEIAEIKARGADVLVVELRRSLRPEEEAHATA